MRDWVEKLTEAIAGQLEDGIRLTPDELHYLESMTGLSTAADLEQELKVKDSAETCSLMELFFFPDEARQCGLEPIIEKADPEGTHVSRVQKALCSKQLHARLIFPDGTMTGHLPVPQDAVCAYVRRLNLLRSIDQSVAEAVYDHIKDRHEVLRVRVLLRNSRIVFFPPVISFLCDFFRIMPEKSQNWPEALTQAVGVLESAGAGTNLYTAFMDQKRQCAEMIRRGENTARELKQLPVEAMIMRGTSIACMGADEARRKMAIFDEIAINIFGQTEITEFTDQPVTITM